MLSADLSDGPDATEGANDEPVVEPGVGADDTEGRELRLGTDARCRVT